MKYTTAEKEKIYESLIAINDYIEREIQPNITSSITVDFGTIKSYVDGTREKEFHLYVSPKSISCRQGGLGFDYAKTSTRNSTNTTVYSNYEYAVALMKEWHNIKATLHTAVANENETRNMINNFHI